jgi:hypothetical protein
MDRLSGVAQAGGVEHSEVDKARRRLEEARQVLDHGRVGASRAWLEAVEDYIRKCQEEYVRALEQAQRDMPQRPAPRGWGSSTNGPSAREEEGRKKPN